MYVYVYIYVKTNQQCAHKRAHTHMYIHPESRTSIFDIYSGKPCIHLWLELRCSKLGRVKLQVEHFGAALGSTRGRTWQDVSDPKPEKMGRWPPLPLHKESWAGSIPNRQVRKSPISWVTCQSPFFRCEFQRRIQSPSVGWILCSMPTLFFVY